MQPVKPNGVDPLDIRSESTPPIETIVEHEQAETDMARISSPPPSSFAQKIGPNTILTLAGAIIGAAVGWGVASTTINHLEKDVAHAQRDIAVLQRAQADADSERSAMRQWMVDHGIKLATPPMPKTGNGEDQ